MSKIDTLHPLIREEVRALVQRVNTDILKSDVKMLVTQGLRTFEEQNALFKKVPKVTNAKAGQSMHNYGLAFDFCLVKNGITIWDTAKDFDGDKNPDWMEVVNLFKDAGYKWGGDFKSIIDKPHFEKTFGHTWQTLLNVHTNKKVDDNNYILI